MPEKWGFELCGAYAGPTFRLTNRIKMQKIKELRLEGMLSWTVCSRFRLFTNCTPLNPTICIILPDRDITKIAETVLVSAICLILPFGFVTPERLWIFRQLTGIQYGYLNRNAERTLLGHLSTSAIINNLMPCCCKNSITNIDKNLAIFTPAE